MQIAEWVFDEIDYSTRFKPLYKDGDKVSSGSEIALIEGRARAILTAERLALNFISFLSGIATETSKYVEATKAYNVKILDTRKTLPLLRYLEKYAVVCAGGFNHRMSLNDMVLIKDNHLMLSGSKVNVAQLRGKLGPKIKIEVEVDNLKDFEKMLSQKPDVIMLDNMSPSDIARAVAIRNSAAYRDEVTLEASGGITLANIVDYAKAGPDTISIGRITDTVEGIDFSLDITE
jgi:nicotinate-nucleotide pyrophosphorylase (carboxylating)